MIQFDNPIFITQRRLIKRNAFWALILGTLGLGAVIVLLHFKQMEHSASSTQRLDMSLLFYAWILSGQFFLAVLAAAARASRGIAEEHRSGRLEANTLTPLSNAQLLVGYTAGLPFLFFIPALGLAPAGLVILLSGGAPLWVFVNSQLLLMSASVLAWLAAITMGLAFKKNQIGAVVILFMIFGGFPLATELGGAFLGTYVIPIFPILADFADAGLGRVRHADTTFFGVSVSRHLLSFGIQAVIGFFLWHAARRKIANPDEPAFSARLAVSCFGLLAVIQHGLSWSMLHDGHTRHLFEGLTVIQGGMLFVGCMFLMGLAMDPNRLRRDLLRDESRQLFARRASRGLKAALLMSAITAGFLFLHAGLSADPEFSRVFIASASALTVFLGLAAALDIGSLTLGNQARPAVVGGFFLLLIGTLVVGAITRSEEFMFVTSPVVDGIYALGSSKRDFFGEHSSLLTLAALFHLLVAGGLLLVRRNATRFFAQKAALGR
jgi:hypothetical protein